MADKRLNEQTSLSVSLVSGGVVNNGKAKNEARPALYTTARTLKSRTELGIKVVQTQWRSIKSDSAFPGGYTEQPAGVR